MKKSLYILISLLFPALVFAQTAKKPNIIIILADDMGWNDVGFHGSEIKTPNIDQLAKDGVIMNRYYSAPICSPARAGILTGRYPNRFGLREEVIPPWRDFGVDTAEVFIPQMLAEAGYKNRAALGKWHLGHSRTMYLPLHRGFTHFYGFYNGAEDYFTHERSGELDWHNDENSSYDKGYTTDLIATEAVNDIKKYSKDPSPFFMYVAFNAPHGPLQAKKEDLLLYGYDEKKPQFADDDAKSGLEDEGGAGTKVGRGNTKRQTYSAMVTCLDRGIGQILATLKNLNIDDNTIIIFQSDNGAPKTEGGSNGALRGFKYMEWEGGVRVPAIIKWPAGFKGGKITNQVMGYIDLMPTLRDIVGLKSQPKNPLDGVNILPVLKGQQQTLNRNMYLGYGDVINNDWKLIQGPNGNNRMKVNEDLLFHISADPNEQNNTKADNTETYNKLKAEAKPYEAIKSKMNNPPKTAGQKGFKPPKEWKVEDK